MKTDMWKINLGDGETVWVEPGDVEDVDLDAEGYSFAGERLTEAHAVQIAREVMRKHGLRGGRPRKAEAERASVQKAVRFTPGQAADLENLARARGVKVSDVIRDATLRELASV